jgi:hypothetical protein
MDAIDTAFFSFSRFDHTSNKTWLKNQTGIRKNQRISFYCCCFDVFVFFLNKAMTIQPMQMPVLSETWCWTFLGFWIPRPGRRLPANAVANLTTSSDVPTVTHASTSTSSAFLPRPFVHYRHLSPSMASSMAVSISTLTITNFFCNSFGCHSIHPC